MENTIEYEFLFSSNTNDSLKKILKKLGIKGGKSKKDMCISIINHLKETHPGECMLMNVMKHAKT